MPRGRLRVRAGTVCNAVDALAGAATSSGTSNILLIRLFGGRNAARTAEPCRPAWIPAGCGARHAGESGCRTEPGIIGRGLGEAAGADREGGAGAAPSERDAEQSEPEPALFPEAAERRDADDGAIRASASV